MAAHSAQRPEAAVMMDMMMGPAMSDLQMSLKGTYNVGTVLVNGNKITTPAQFFVLVLLLIVFAFLTQLFHVMQASMKQQVKEKHLSAVRKEPQNIDNAATNNIAHSFDKDGTSPMV